MRISRIGLRTLVLRLEIAASDLCLPDCMTLTTLTIDGFLSVLLFSFLLLLSSVSFFFSPRVLFSPRDAAMDHQQKHRQVGDVHKRHHRAEDRPYRGEHPLASH